MPLRRSRALGDLLLTRLTVAGMSLAVLALGGLSLWSAFTVTNEATGLSRGGVQITGQLRALQALYVVRTEMDALEEELSAEHLGRLRAAVRVLPQELARMRSGDSAEAVRAARAAEPLAAELGPALERFIADPRGDINYRGDDGDDTAEDATEDLVDELEVLLNDADSDPARLLADKLEHATDAGGAVQRAVAVLLPLALVSVVGCAWLLTTYRRRSEAVMQTALEQHAQEARTDQLTGLPNRRGVLEELHRRCNAGDPFTFALADLNGFKHYNDTFGHPAGDALLRRLGQALGRAVEGQGFAGRLGGDEFCVLADALSPDELQALVARALSEQGDGFRISTESGVVLVPAEAADASAVLGLADSRLYAAKAVVHASRGSDGRGRRHPQPTVADPAHVANLADRSAERDRTVELAARCAQVLGLSAQDVAMVRSAAHLREIGKSALPAAILVKRDALTDDERRFLQRHPAITQRLLTGDDLAPVAAIIRSSTERWDGGGYPDRLVGDQIPIGSRILAVAAAFAAMTRDRPYAPARSAAEALTELAGCAGSQFDPAVAAALTAAVRQDRAASVPS